MPDATPDPTPPPSPAAGLDPQLRSAAAPIDRALETLGQRLRRRFLVHGLGWMLAAIAAGIGLYFILDRALDLPRGVRVVISIGLVAFLIYGLRRRVLYPLGRAFSRDDVATAVERRFPQLRQRLISAVQLARREELHGESPAMVEEVVRTARAELDALPTAEVLDPRRTRRVWGIGAGLAAIAVVALTWTPGTAPVFFQRMLGASTSYPRETTLVVELPESSNELRVALAEGTARVVIPAGGDLPVLVRAEGVVPREVALITERSASGAAGEVAMTQRGEDRFRHVFRRIGAGFSFYARGGDDPTGDLLVTVEVVEPPRVATITAKLTFPEYTKLEAKELVGGGIEAVVNSRAELTVTATAPVLSATLHLLDSEREVSLQPVTIEDDQGTSYAYTGSIDIVATDRYQIVFVGPDEISSPHPGTYPIVAIEDHAPVARLLTPGNSELDVVLPTALLPVRIVASDDFGIAEVSASTVSGENEYVRSTRMFDGASVLATQATTETFATALLEVADLGDTPVTVGETIVVSGAVRDNRQPEEQVAELRSRNVAVVGPSDLARRISSHFRRIRDSVEKALNLQSDRRDRLLELREDMKTADGEELGLANRIITIEVGQGRVLAEARRLHRELKRSFDFHLFNRLEESLHAPKVVELYSTHHRENPSDVDYPDAFYRAVTAERRVGTIGAMEKTLDPILQMIETADGLATQTCPEAIRAIEGAAVASESDATKEALDRAAASQAAILASLESLRSRLDEWNELRDVLTQTRSIRDKQKDIRARTKTLQGGTK